MSLIKWLRLSALVNVILLIAICVMGYFLWFKQYPVPYDIDAIEEREKQLHMENTILLHGIKVNEDKIKVFEQTIDSLQKVPAKIKSEYAKKYKKIDTYSVKQLTNELDSAYANDNR